MSDNNNNNQKPRKKGPRILGGIALLGVAVAIAGLALGGRPGGLTVRNGNFTYVNPTETITMGPAPSWWGNNWRWVISTGWGDQGWWRNANDEPADKPVRPAQPDASAVSTPIPSSELASLDITVSTGYITIVGGSEPGLQVVGPMSYTNDFNNGHWTIRADENISGIHTQVREVDGRTHFFRDGVDITTEFIVTVPTGAGEIYAELAMGEIVVQDVTAANMELSVDMASLKVYNCTVSGLTKMTANMGGIYAEGLKTGDCELEANMGGINMRGEVTGTLEAETSMGGVEITLPRPADYGWTAEVGAGSIKIDGKSVAAGLGSSSSGGNPNALPYFDLEAGMGGIEIHFR